MTNLFLLCLSLIYTGVNGRDCYNCVYNENPDRANFKCVNSPEDYDGGPHVEKCTTTDQCYITRQVTVGTGEIYTLYRGCDYTNKRDGCTSDSTGSYETCHLVCNDEDFCNDKDVEPPPPTTAGPPSRRPGTGRGGGGGGARRSRNRVAVTQPPPTPPEPTNPPLKYVECYLCQYSYNPNGNDKCVRNPTSASKISCAEGRSCYVQSQWDKGEKVWRSFSRGCEDMRHRMKECMDSVYFNDCMSTCCYDRCNVGDGSEGEDYSCRAPTFPPPTRPPAFGGGGPRSPVGSGGRMIVYKRKRMRGSGSEGQNSNRGKIWVLVSLALSMLCMLFL